MRLFPMTSRHSLSARCARLSSNSARDPPLTERQEAEQEGIIECRFYSTGMVALLADNRLVAVADYKDPHPKILAQPPSDEVIAWCLVPPAFSLSRSVEVLLAINQTINVVDVSDSEDRMLQNGPFRHIAVSPNGKFVSLYTDDAKVWVISADFQEKLSEYSTRVKSPPKDLQWCGNDAVVLAWEDEIHLVGPDGHATRYYYDSYIQLLPDVDGVRVLTNDSLEFIQRVPDVNASALNPGSSAPAAILLDAVAQLDQKSPKADDNVQMIRPRLIDAVDDCISAAGGEYEIHWQKQLLKGASFGKTVLNLYDPEEFVSMLDTTRILNAVRYYEIGIPLSHDQYLRLGPERLIQRLVSRRQYLLALRLSETLHLSTEAIYTHWACEKIRSSSEDDETTSHTITSKFESRKGMHYDAIARVAFDEGRPKLATALLNEEPLAGKQVPLLIEMSQGNLALDKAMESGDNDLILMALLNLRSKLPLAQFFRTINTRPIASALVEATAREEDGEMLKDLYYQDDRRLDGALLLFADALSQADPSAGITKLRASAKLLQDSKDLGPQAKIVDDTARLLKLQESLDHDPSLAPGEGDSRAQHRFTGMSLNDTVYHLILKGHTKRAAKIVSDLKMSDRTFWWLRLRALVAARSWRELEEFGTKTKKSPIGWDVFVQEVLAAGNPRLAGAVFVPKCTGLSGRERAEMYVKCGMIPKAAEEGAKANDVEFVEELLGRADGRDVLEVQRIRQSMQKGRR